MHKEEANIKNKVKKVLATQLGVEPEDIADDDFLKEDLHMNPVDLVDFIHNLQEAGIETSTIEMTEVETLQDLVDQIV